MAQKFSIKSDFTPSGDQPDAIAALLAGLSRGEREQVLLGVTGSGKIKMSQAGKRHGMIKRSTKFIRNARGSTTMAEADAKIVKRNFLRNSL